MKSAPICVHLWLNFQMEPPPVRHRGSFISPNHCPSLVQSPVMNQRSNAQATAAVVMSVGLLICAGHVAAPSRAQLADTSPMVRQAVGNEREGVDELVSSFELALQQLQKHRDSKESKHLITASYFTCLPNGVSRELLPATEVAAQPASLQNHLLNLPPPVCV